MSIELPPFGVLSALFFVVQNCQRWQFYGHLPKLQTMAVLWTLFEVHVHSGHTPWGFCMIQNCKRWQFYGHFLEFWPKTANGGSSMDTFRSCGNPVTKLHFLKTQKKVQILLQMVAVLWTLFKTAIYGRCSQVIWELNIFFFRKNHQFQDDFMPFCQFWCMYAIVFN